MPVAEGTCPFCESRGPVGEPCPERGCARAGYCRLPDDAFRRLMTVPPEARDPAIGRRIADYLLVDALGAGGFGRVYLALQTPIGMRTALKLMDRANADPALADALGRKFEAEAAALAQLSHPNIVRLLKYGVHGGLPYLVMEYVEGRTLKGLVTDLVSRGEELPPDAVPHVLRQLANALEAAHARGIVHRDVKPENLMIQAVEGDPWHVKVLDFGLAKFVDERSETSMVLGTPMYMAPEQVARRDIGPWTDLYAAGVLAFELLTGRRPFAGRTTQEVLARKLDPGYDPLLRAADLALPACVADFLRRAVARDPADRFRTAAAFREALDGLFAQLDRNQRTLVANGDVSALVESRDLARLHAERTREAERSQAPAMPPAAAPPPAETPAPATGARPRARAWPWILLVGLLLAGGWAAGGWYALRDAGRPSMPAPGPGSGTAAADPCATGAYESDAQVATCVETARRLRLGRGTVPDERRAVAMLDKACDRGHAGACLDLGLLHLYDDESIGRRDPQRMKAYLEKACTGGQGNACFCLVLAHMERDFGLVGVDRPSDADARALDERLAGLARRGCEAGSGPACMALGQWWYARGSLTVAPDADKARDLITRGMDLAVRQCSPDAPLDCWVAGFAWTKRKFAGIERNLDKAIDVLRTGCSGGFAEACASLGYAEVLRYRDGGIEGMLPQIRDALSKACLKRSELGCETLLGLAIRGDEVLSVVDQACNRGAGHACDALWQSFQGSRCQTMLKIPDAEWKAYCGSPARRDLRKAEEYRVLACKAGVATACTSKTFLVPPEPAPKATPVPAPAKAPASAKPAEVPAKAACLRDHPADWCARYARCARAQGRPWCDAHASCLDSDDRLSRCIAVKAIEEAF